MSKYNNGKIYKLCPKVYDDDYIPYYGYTIEKHLCNRLGKYKSYFKNYLIGKYSYHKYFKLFYDYGFDNVNIILIENYPCNSQNELNARLEYHVKKNKCLNKIENTIEELNKMEYNKIDFIKEIQDKENINLNNTSKYRGVSFNKYMKKWQSSICNKSNKIHLGYFDDIIEAAKTYNKKAIELLGEKAKLNIII